MATPVQELFNDIFDRLGGDYEAIKSVIPSDVLAHHLGMERRLLIDTYNTAIVEFKRSVIDDVAYTTAEDYYDNIATG